MEQYHQLLKRALSGEHSPNERTGAGTVGVFQEQASFDLGEGVPIVTTKPVYWKGVAVELLWFLRGETNIRPLIENRVGIWSSDALRFNMEYVLDSGLIEKGEVKEAQADAKRAREILIETSTPIEERKGEYESLMKSAGELVKRFEGKIIEDEEFANSAGELGPVYGAQWRGNSPTQPIDQLEILEDALRNGGYNRRLIVNAWNPQDAPNMALPPCHYVWQVNVSPESGKLTLGWSQRSCDTVLGVPFNIASYGLLAHLLAHTHDLEPGKLVGKFEDLHVYVPHIPAAKEQLEREIRPIPKLEILTKRESVAEYTYDDLRLIDYDKHPKLENPTPMFGGFF
jgi:thymidylate synthase